MHQKEHTKIAKKCVQCPLKRATSRYEKPLTDVISKNKLTSLKYSPAKSPSMQATALQNDCNYFPIICILSCQERSGDFSAM